LVVNGEQGSTKSSVSRLARRAVDPSDVPLRSVPKDERDLFVAAHNAWVLPLDNLSSVPDWLSDGLSRLSTGGGFGSREHYTSTEESVVSATRPVIINGIPELSSRPDFADRAICLTLPAIDEHARRSEREYWAEVEERLPRILGALLTGVASAIRNRNLAHEKLGRMADFERWVLGAEADLWGKGRFVEAYTRNRTGAVETAIEADPIGPAVCRLVKDQDWLGVATKLLEDLGEQVTEAVRRSRYWPVAPNTLRGRLRRLEPALRAKGVTLDLDHRSSDTHRARIIGIRRVDRANSNAE
jgi:hypothetical protein